jgi:signal transduction histidine kinase
MSKRLTNIRIVAPFAVTSVILLALSGVGAVYLYRLQANPAAELEENISSRRAALAIEEAVRLLIQDHNDDASAAPIRARLPGLIAVCTKHTNKPLEGELVGRMQDAHRTYVSILQTMPPPGDPKRTQSQVAAIDALKNGIEQAAHALWAYENVLIEISQQAIHESLQYAAWGLVLVGFVGSTGGLILGIGMARWLRQRIHRLQVQVRDAADKLGQELPTVVLKDGDLAQLDEQVQSVALQIEHVVQKLQQRERDILRSEQLAAVGQMAAGMAHEIRNPLTAIKLLVETAREEADGHPARAEDLRIMEEEIRRMERSLNAFLTFARPPRPEKSPQELSDLIEQTLSLVQGRAAKQNVAVEFHKPPRTVLVEADGGQLQQVFVNLAFNSLDAMPSGGRLVVDVKSPINGSVELELRDTGPGIAPEIRSRLFEPFASNKETGVGLGLVISKRIVEDHGGSIHADVTHRNGASFIVKLPTLAS